MYYPSNIRVMHLALKPLLTLEKATKEAKDQARIHFIKQYGRNPTESELGIAIATEVEMQNTGLMEKIIIDRIECTVKRDHLLSQEYLLSLKRDNDNYYGRLRTPIFNDTIKIYVDKYVDRRIEDAAVVSEGNHRVGNKFAIIYDAYCHTKRTELISKMPESPEYLYINRHDIMYDIYSGLKRPDTPPIFNPVFDQNRLFEMVRTQWPSGIPDIHEYNRLSNDETSEFGSKFNKIALRSQWALYNLLRVADYAATSLLNKALDRGFNIAYVYQKLNMYDFACLIANYPELRERDVAIYVPIMDSNMYRNKVIQLLNQKGIHTPPALVNSLQDRYYSFLMYSILYTTYPVYVAGENSKSRSNNPGLNPEQYILIDRSSGISPGDLSKLRNINDPKIVMFIELANQVNKYIKSPKLEGTTYIYDLKLPPEVNLNRVTDPEILEDIALVMKNQMAVIDQLEKHSRPEFIIVSGPMGSGKSYWSKQLTQQYPGVYSIDIDQLTSYFRKYEREKTQIIHKIRNDFNRFASSDRDILIRTMELIMCNSIHFRYVNYACIIYFQLLQYAVSKNVHILTELTLKIPIHWFLVWDMARMTYKITIHVVHTKFDQQYYIQLKRGLTERRLAFRDYLINATNDGFQTMLSIIQNPEYSGVDIYIYENTNHKMKLLLKRVSDTGNPEVTCHGSPETLSIETGVIDLFAKLCNKVGSGPGLIYRFILIIVGILIIIIVIPCIIIMIHRVCGIAIDSVYHNNND